MEATANHTQDHEVHVDGLGRAFCASCAGERPLNHRRSDLGGPWLEMGIGGTHCDACNVQLWA